MHVLDVDELVAASCSVTAWRPGVPGITEVFHANIADYAYPAHCHDTWTVLLVDAGAIAYDLDRRQSGQRAHRGLAATWRGPRRSARDRSSRVPQAQPLPRPRVPAPSLTGAAVDRTNLHDFRKLDWPCREPIMTTKSADGRYRHQHPGGPRWP